jgi:hypothetical protein
MPLSLDRFRNPTSLVGCGEYCRRLLYVTRHATEVSLVRVVGHPVRRGFERERDCAFVAGGIGHDTNPSWGPTTSAILRDCSWRFPSAENQYFEKVHPFGVQPESCRGSNCSPVPLNVMLWNNISEGGPAGFWLFRRRRDPGIQVRQLRVDQFEGWTRLFSGKLGI